MKDLCKLTVSDASSALARGVISSVDIVEAYIDRISDRDHDVKAWTYIDYEAALAQAQACDRRPRDSALHGIPVALKDVIDTKDMPTEYGSKLFTGYRPLYDAICVCLLRRAGCVILGKTVTTEFAMFQPGKTRNPYDQSRTPGGSSSGSAAAVADFQVPFSLTTQTSGSTIKPAAFCGVVGFKPTFSSIPIFGVRPQAQSLDTLGIMSRSAQDLRLVWDALQGTQPRLKKRTATAELAKQVRVGICQTPYWDKAENSQRSVFRDVTELLKQRGVKVVEVTLPPEFNELNACHSDLMAYEASRNFTLEYFGDKRDSLGELTVRSLEDGWRVTTDRYIEARRQTELAKNSFRRQMEGLAGLLVPAVPGEAPSLTTTGDSVFSKTWSLLGVPTITLPVSMGPLGLPLAVQLVGMANDDELLMDLASSLQAILLDAYGSPIQIN